MSIQNIVFCDDVHPRLDQEIDVGGYFASMNLVQGSLMSRQPSCTGSNKLKFMMCALHKSL
jgi:hypothetical protein